jgi:hypothetical protein
VSLWFEDDFNRTDLGFDVALGLRLPFVLAELRYSQSLGDSYAGDEYEVTNRTFSLLSGISFYT